MNKRALLLAATLNVPLSVYSADAPPLSLAQDAVLQIYSKRDKCVKISAFEKKDGQSSEGFGVHYYSMDYSAQLTFIVPCYAKYDAEQKKFSRGPNFNDTGIMKGQSKLFQPGESVTVLGKVYFEKKESGWHKQ